MNEPDPKPTLTEAIAHILVILGFLFLLVGLIALAPSMFDHGLAIGLIYSGGVMVVLGFVVDRI